MEALVFNATEDSPLIRLEPESNMFLISGSSLPEDPAAFYAPVLEWISGYVNTPNGETVFIFHFNYFNTASAKQVFKMLNLLKSLPSLRVEWHYDKGDTDMMESGERFSKLTGLELVLSEK